VLHFHKNIVHPGEKPNRTSSKIQLQKSSKPPEMEKDLRKKTKLLKIIIDSSSALIHTQPLLKLIPNLFSLP